MNTFIVILLIWGRCVLTAFLPPHIGRQSHLNAARQTSLHRRDDTDPSLLYPAHNFSVPIDHFPSNPKYSPHSNRTFPLRYWYDASYYKPGGPVIVLASGETSGVGRLPFLQKGILHQLIEATAGIGVVLEHRYYGTSFPVEDLSVNNLRFLDTQQALADTRFFAENVVFEGLEGVNLTARDTAWIVYGGSYAGAFVAFLRVLYPDTFWGAISSSGVTEAIYDYWQYWEPIRIYGPQDCVYATQQFVQVIDGILIDHQDNETLSEDLKDVFGLGNIMYDNDFAYTLTTYGIGTWQGRNWDPAVNDPSFEHYCGNVSSTSLMYPWTSSLRSTVESLISASGRISSAQANETFTTQLLNYIGWTNASLITPCTAQNLTLDQCYSTHNSTYYAQTALSTQTWRSWAWQYCTQWGYYQTGSGAPQSILPLYSRTIDLDFITIVCREAFNVSGVPDLESINQYGGFDIEAERLAIIDGEQDPWRWATPHAPGARFREDTIDQPFRMIPAAVHHWDENGLFPNETTAELPPLSVRDIQAYEVQFVKAWVEEYERERRQKKR